MKQKTEIHKWTSDQEEFLKANIKGKTRNQIAKMLNEEFGIVLTRNQIKTCASRLGVSSGLDGRFIKGHTPVNKGKKQSEYMSEEAIERTKATRFQKGVAPPNTKPLGATRIDKQDKIKWVKVSMTGKQFEKWKAAHYLVWEEANGPVPDKHRIIALDGNLSNTDLSNLRCVSGRVAAYLARNKGFYDDKDLNDISINIAELETTVSKLNNKEELNEE